MAREVHVGKYKVIKDGKATNKFTWYNRFERKDVAEDGKRQFIKRSGYRTRDEAMEEGQTAIAIEYGVAVSDGESHSTANNNPFSNMSIEDYIQNIWLENNERAWKSSTLEGYQKAVRNYIYPQFGKMAINLIDSIKLQEYFDKLYRDTSTAISSIDNRRALFTQIFKYAFENKHISFNPMQNVRKPNLRVETSVDKNKQVRDVIPDSVLNEIFKRFPEETPAHIPLQLCLCCGLREAEAFAVAFSDIDFENHRIFINRQIQRRDKKRTLTAREKEMVKAHPELADFSWVTTNPKYDSKRVVPMPPNLEKLLLREKERQKSNKAQFETYTEYHYIKATAPLKTLDYDEFCRHKAVMDFEDGIVNEIGIGYPIDFVCRYADGKLITKNVTDYVSRVVHGLEGSPREIISKTFNIHSLRHSFASRMRASGQYSEHLIRDFLGHKSEIETKTYMHISENEFNSAVVKMMVNETKVDRLFSALLLQKLSFAELKELYSRIGQLCSSEQGSLHE